MFECYELRITLEYVSDCHWLFFNRPKIVTDNFRMIKNLKKCLVKIQDIFSHKNKYVKYPYTLSQTMSQQLKKKIPKAWGLYRVDQEPYTIGLKRSISY